MSTAKYGPTSPVLSEDTLGNGVLTKPDGGVLTSFTTERMDLQVISDDKPHDLCVQAILPDRVSQVQVFVEAYNAAGGRVAAGTAILQVIRLGSAPIAPFVGTPLMLSYTPNSPGVWDSSTVLADLATMPSGTDISVRVQYNALPAVPIRWRATTQLVGAQAQSTT